MPYRGQRCPGWEALPADVLSIIFRMRAASAQEDGPISLRQALELVGSPCRHWAAVATAEVPLRLRLESYRELEHPLLRRSCIEELTLPEAPLAQPLHQHGSADEAAAAAQQAQANAAAAVTLLTSPGFLRHSGPRLVTLLNLPTATAALAPVPLLHAFPRLRRLGLQATSVTPSGAGLAPPGFFPPTVRRIEAAAHSIDSLGWLPGWHLEIVTLTATNLRLTHAAEPPALVVAAGGEAGLDSEGGGSGSGSGIAPPAAAGGLASCTSLRLTARDCLSVTVVALASLARCERLELRCEAGKQLTVQPLLADEEAVWQDVPGPLYDHSLPVTRLLPKWLRALAPLFGPGSSLRSLDLSASRLYLAVHSNDFWFWGLQLLSPLPPPAVAAPEGPAVLAPPAAPAAAPHMEVLREGGLSATLQCPAEEHATCTLSLTRTHDAASL